ncbi:MAG: hypothetical protein HYV53_00065 [Parcubacteria group bacterium]|nr:hypothetical protein [Parcubacteria group bacterium]
MEIKKILIPNKPHLDPIAAVYLLSRYGQEKFSGIDSAEIIFWENSHDPKPEDINKFISEKILTIDIGGGRFDHHKSLVKETAASLVAAYLGIENNPELIALLNYIREDDLEGLHNRYGDLAYLIKCFHKQNLPSLKVVELGLRLINYFQTSQIDWHYNVKKEYESKSKIYKIKRFNNKIKIGVVESDNSQLANYGLTMDSLSAVVQKRSSGHVMILTNKHHRLNLREIVAAIRMRELELSGYNKPVDPLKLQFEGKNSLIPNWFYHRNLNAFLNGSEALNKAEPTKLKFSEIVSFVWNGLSSEHSEYCDCDQGGYSCPFVKYGFSKCQERKFANNIISE